MTVNAREIASGLVLVFIGGFYLYNAWPLAMGTALNMGPGYFPTVLSAIVMAIGLIVAVRGLAIGEHVPFGIVPWRAIILLPLAICFFAAFLGKLGLLAAVIVSSFVAAQSSRQTTLVFAAVTSVCLGVFCSLLFGPYGIGLSIPIVGPWLNPS